MQKIIRTCVVFIGCLLLPGIVGFITNMINSIISPEYFIKIMHWDTVQNIMQATIAQGIYQGIIQGIFFTLLFTCVYIVSLKSDIDLRKTLLWISYMAVATIGLWILGGLIAILLSVLSPEFYKKTFIGVPDDFGAMIRYAWVGGSIWGATFGGMLVMIIGTILYRNNYKKKIL